MKLGYWLSSEEHPAATLVGHAVAAERAGFTTAMISDHFHPWTPAQGHSSFVWTVLGAMARATTSLEIGTGVTAPIHRLHPVVVAHAAATVASLMPGRFILGLGTGERLNEQITGERWPRPGERREMLGEAIEIIRRVWEGEPVNHRGEYYAVESARLFTQPDALPPIFVAASGMRTAKLAGEMGDGLLAVEPNPRLTDAFVAGGGSGKPAAGQLHVCIAADEAHARKVALRYWPNGAIRGAALSDLARPEDFDALADLVDEDDVATAVVCGADPAPHLSALRRFAGAGFDTVYIHQVGPDQDAMFDFYTHEIIPAL